MFNLADKADPLMKTSWDDDQDDVMDGDDSCYAARLYRLWCLGSRVVPENAILHATMPAVAGLILYTSNWRCSKATRERIPWSIEDAMIGEELCQRCCKPAMKGIQSPCNLGRQH